MSQNAWLTPESIPSGTRMFTLPVPDDEAWFAIVRGALVPLIYAANFQAHGALTPEQVADRFAQMFIQMGEADTMLKIIYDTDDDGVVDAAESVPWAGVSGKPATFPPELPVVDETPLVFKTGSPTVTATLDANALSAARSFALPNLDTMLAGLAVSNLFTVRQDIRTSGSAIVSGLYVPWITGDSLPTLQAGSVSGSNNQLAIRGISATNVGVRGDTASATGVYGTASGAGAGVGGISVSGIGGQFISTSGFGFQAQSNTGVPLDILQVTGTDNASNDLLIIRKRPLSAAAANFGAAMVYKLSSSTTADQLAGRLSYEWATATHASRKARGKISAYDTAERECIRVEADGSAAMLGLLGAAAIPRQTIAAAATDLATAITLLNDIRSKLISFGLMA